MRRASQALRSTADSRAGPIPKKCRASTGSPTSRSTRAARRSPTSWALENGLFDPKGATGCFANHRDWQLPGISEVQTILVGPDAAPGQAPTCASAPCLDPDFAALDGPTASNRYWSSAPAPPFGAWIAALTNGPVEDSDAEDDRFARAVCRGSRDRDLRASVEERSALAIPPAAAAAKSNANSTTWRLVD
jgi:hypothetical protein